MKKFSTLIKEELENQENYIAGEKDLQKVRDLLHTVEYRKKQHAEVLLITFKFTSFHDL